MTTVADICMRALRLLRVIDPEEIAEPWQYMTAMVTLNAMMLRWEADGLANGWTVVDNPADVLPAPAEAEEAIAANLAVKLRPEYGANLDPDVIQMARDGLAALRTDMLNTTHARLELDLPCAEGEAARRY